MPTGPDIIPQPYVCSSVSPFITAGPFTAANPPLRARKSATSAALGCPDGHASAASPLQKCIPVAMIPGTSRICICYCFSPVPWTSAFLT
jgi:hypothetical protein